MKDICDTHLFLKIILFKLALVKGLEGVEVWGKNQSFSVLKHKPKVGVDAIFCMILTTLLSNYQYTLFFQPNLS